LVSSSPHSTHNLPKHNIPFRLVLASHLTGKISPSVNLLNLSLRCFPNILDVSLTLKIITCSRFSPALIILTVISRQYSLTITGVIPSHPWPISLLHTYSNSQIISSCPFLLLLEQFADDSHLPTHHILTAIPTQFPLAHPPYPYSNPHTIPTCPSTISLQQSPHNSHLPTHYILTVIPTQFPLARPPYPCSNSHTISTYPPTISSHQFPLNSHLPTHHILTVIPTQFPLDHPPYPQSNSHTIPTYPPTISSE
jgi:hypothetical protein